MIPIRYINLWWGKLEEAKVQKNSPIHLMLLNLSYASKYAEVLSRLVERRKQEPSTTITIDNRELGTNTHNEYKLKFNPMIR